MKPEAEIRKHLADLRTARNLPCDCAEGEHAIGCYIGGRMMDASIDVLLWALGENEDRGRLNEDIAANVARHKVGG